MSNKAKTTPPKPDGKPALVPKLRFPEFRDAEGWEEETLSGVATVVMGSSPKSECYNQSQTGLPLLQGNADIKNRLSAPRIFTSEITKECTIGDILLSVRAPVGSVAKSIHHACIGRGIAAVRADQPNSQEFVYQWLLSYEPRWGDISQGGTFDAVNSDDLKGVAFAVPRPAEQQKIAESLSSVDELIAAQARKLDALKTHKKGLMQLLFPREGETQPRLRFPEFRSGPKWAMKKIGRMLNETPRPIALEDESEYCLVTVKRRYGGLVSRGVLKGKEIKVNSQFLVKADDFLISKRQIVHNACGLVPIDLDGSVVSNEYSVLTPAESCDIHFFDYFAQQPYVSESFMQCSVGIVIEKMLFKLDRWLKTEFSFPLFDEQRRIADCLNSLDDLITAQTQKLEALKTHKKGLMQRLFPSLDEVEA